MAKVGIDFGTSNSSVIWHHNNRDISLLMDMRLVETPAAPSTVFINRRNEIQCGYEINNSNHDADRAQVVYSLKTKLRDDQDNSLIYGFDKWDLLKHYFKYLINTANNSAYLKNENDRVTEVVLSVPFKSSSLYRDKLQKSVEEISYQDSKGRSYRLQKTEVIEEPAAISLNKFYQYPHANYVFVYDMGGGTLDMAVVQNLNGRKAVIKHGGIPQAGDYWDELIVRYALKKSDFDADSFFSNSNRSLRRSLRNARIAKEGIEREGEAFLSLLFNGNEVYDDILTEEEYHDIIKNHIADTMRDAKSLVAEAGVSIDYVVAAGGGANCRFLKTKLEEAFHGMQISSDFKDTCIATAAGNAKYEPANLKSILNYSYGVDVYDGNNRKCVDILFFKDQVLPVNNVKKTYCTRAETDKVIYNFYTGMVSDSEHNREYDFSTQELLAGKEFYFNFGHKVAKGTKMENYFTMDENGILTITIRSDAAQVSTQTFTIADLK